MSDQMWQGFGFGEMGYLLIQADVPAVARARDLFDLVDHAFSDDVAMASVSSLMAHGLLEIDETGVPRPLGAAALLTYAIAEATRWVRIGFFSVGEEVVDGAVLLHAPEATVVMQPRPGGSWVMVAKDPRLTDAEAIWSLVSGFSGTTSSASAFVEVEDRGGRATLFVQRDAAATWTLALGESALWPEQRRDGVDDAAVTELLRMALESDLSAVPSSDAGA